MTNTLVFDMLSTASLICQSGFVSLGTHAAQMQELRNAGYRNVATVAGHRG